MAYTKAVYSPINNLPLIKFVSNSGKSKRARVNSPVNPREKLLLLIYGSNRDILVFQSPSEATVLKIYQF